MKFQENDQDRLEIERFQEIWPLKYMAMSLAIVLVVTVACIPLAKHIANFLVKL